MLHMLKCLKYPKKVKFLYSSTCKCKFYGSSGLKGYTLQCPNTVAITRGEGIVDLELLLNYKLSKLHQNTVWLRQFGP